MKQVLYIDDNRDDLFLFHRACELAGVTFQLRTVESGRAGIEFLAAERPLPDFVLLDIKMAGMDGFEVLHWIRHQPAAADLPVALYSSSLLDEDVLRGYLVGSTYFIPKPTGITGMMQLARALDDSLKSVPRQWHPLQQLSIPPTNV